ncbi:hypothetical protein QVD17_17885 [Tagetes erecta]|uniref:Senescence regulator n=1 Tax=Tagetes erecta TaxID=13708 RepID=A0AAD8KGR9_TARER|nr:hypothetical protein QVD17_17885 [Tagetes erecta]
MAKGRSLTISRSERFLRTYGYNHDNNKDDDNVELGEDDVWSMIDDVVSTSDWRSHETTTISHRGGHLQPPGPAGGLAAAFDDQHLNMVMGSKRIVHQFRGDNIISSPRGRHLATSAPVNVPDWSKIYRVDSVESIHDSDDGIDDHDSGMVPPHEYLARSHRSAAKSVFEGVGRTLKGRDMSRVREAVWSQTGFDG